MADLQHPRMTTAEKKIIFYEEALPRTIGAFVDEMIADREKWNADQVSGAMAVLSVLESIISEHKKK